MSRRTDIERKTGVSQKQLYRWVDFGLLLPPQQHGAGRGSWYEWSADTEERIKIIQEDLKAGKKLLDCGYELFLLGYTLAPDLIRKVLLYHLDGEDKNRHKGRHTTIDASNEIVSASAERRRYTRSLQRKLEAYAFTHESEQTFIETDHTMAGIPKPGSILYGFPSNDDLRQAVKFADDKLLLEAASYAVTYLASQDETIKQDAYNMGASLSDAANLMTPFHRCKRQHTPMQAWRPFYTMLLICPQWTEEVAARDEIIRRTAFKKLQQEMKVTHFFGHGKRAV